MNIRYTFIFLFIVYEIITYQHTEYYAILRYRFERYCQIDTYIFFIRIILNNNLYKKKISFFLKE